MRRGIALGGLLGLVIVLAACGTSQQGSHAGPLPKGVAWAHDMGAPITSSPMVIGDNLLIGSTKGSLHMVSRKDGSLKWALDARADNPEASFHHEPLLADGVIVTATEGKGGGHVYAIDAASGAVKWKHQLGADPSGQGGAVTEVVRREGNLYVIGLDGKLVCLDMQTGNKVWENGPVETHITPAAGPSLIYAASQQTHIQGFDPLTGASVWDTELLAVVTTSLVAHGEEVYAGTSPFRMFRLNGTTGEILVKLALQGKPVHNPVVTADAVSVFLRDANGTGETAHTILSLDPPLTKILWARRAPQEWTSYHPQIYRDMVLTGDDSGELFAYGKLDGMKKWSVKLDQSLGAIGVSDDMVFVGTSGGSVYALHPPSGGPAGS